jgi:hypothetical protein
MSRSITLTRAAQISGTAYDLTGFRFQVTASAGVGVSPAVFRFLRRPINPASYDDGEVDEFNGLCTVEEMASLPLNNPGTSDDPPFCRKTSIDLIFATQEEAEETWLAIKADVRTLLQALDRMDVLSVQEVVVLST